MLVVVSYDVSTQDAEGRRRLRRIAGICEDYGTRVQNSVFECLVDPEHWAHLEIALLHAYHPDEDSLRFYFLGKKWQNRVKHHGIKKTLDPEGPLIL